MRGVAVYSGERREALDGVLGSGSEPLELTALTEVLMV